MNLKLDRPLFLPSVMLSLILGGWGLGAIAGPRYRTLAPSDPAPPLAGVEVGTGERRDVDWSASSLTLVNFWATWCEPCKEEMPRLQEIYARFAGAGVNIVGVNFEGNISPEMLQKFVRFLGVKYPVLATDPAVDYDWGGIGNYPTSFLIDSRGIVRRRYIGGHEVQTTGMGADIDALLNGRPMPALVFPPEEPDSHIPVGP